MPTEYDRRRQRLADAKRPWKIDRAGAPSPRGYVQLVNRTMRQWTRQVYAALGLNRTADAAEEPKTPAEQAADLLRQQETARDHARRLKMVQLVPPSPPEVEAVGKPAARVSMRTARRSVENVGVPRAQVALRLGVEVPLVLGVDIAPTLAEQAALTTWSRAGTDLIKTVGQDLVEGLDAEIADAARRGVLTRDLRRIVDDRLGVGTRHAQFIARDQVAKLNGKITEATHKAAGITAYKWRASRDQRTRPDHAALDGTIQQWAEPPVVDERSGRREHPGNDFQCRCVAIPVVDLGDIEVDAPKPDGGWQGPVAPARRTEPEPRTVRPPKPRPAPAPAEADWNTWTAPSTAPAPGLRVPPPTLVATPPTGRRFAPGMEVSLDAARFATPERQRAAFLDNWVHGSKSKGAIAMKQAVQAELGVGGEVFQSRKFNLLPGDLAAAQDAVRLQYDMTQASLRASGGAPIRLYRGVTTEYVGHGAIESWTSDPQVARDFAKGRGKVMTQVVTPDRVLAYSGGPGWKNGRYGEQSEWMILAPGATP